MSSSVLAMLRKLMAREAPAQTEPVREALRRSARTGREHAVVGASDKPVGGSVVEGDKYTVMPSSADRNAALMSDRPVLDVHTHPVGALGVRPSPEDFAYYRDKYGAQVRSGPVARELRSLIVQPPERDARASAAYNFFATDKPLAVFDPRRIEDARYELQRGAARGKFRSIMDDPAFRDYFEYGGDIGDLMEDAASLMLLRRRAEQGLGRHELQLGNRLITPDTRATERRLFEMMTPEALELLRAKKMATGGAVKSGDEMSEEEYLARLQQLRPRSGRRAEELNQSRGVNMPLQLARGWAAGTAGLPGDIESLLRMVPLPTRGGLSRASEKTVLPTSEEILPRIPGEDTSPAGQLFSGMGTLAGGAGVTKIARGVNRAADVAGNRMVQAITGNPQATAVGVLQEAAQMSPLAAIVKPKGGNWLSGSVDDVLAPLRQGHGEDAVRALMRANPDVTEQRARELIESQVTPQDRAINRWIDNKLDKYIRNEMATPEDPVRALAERGVLHFQPNQAVNHSWIISAPESRAVSELNKTLGSSDLAKQWEDLTDSRIFNAPAARFQEEGLLDELDPWMKPETRLNTFPDPYRVAQRDVAGDLGFTHLIDELRDAMHPETTLPRNLRLDPKDVDKLTMAQAVERVAKINAWRAEEAAKAERAGMMANLQATPRMADDSLQLSFVEKPGGAWVDIPETVDDKGMKLCTSIGKAGGWCTQAEWAAKSYGSGHNRLTALVDTEGRPHAQAKITSVPSTGDIMEDIDDVMQTMTSAERKKFNRYLGSDDFDGDQEQALNWLQENLPAAHQRYLATVQSNTPPDITELKPPGNSFDSDRAKEYIKRDPQYKAKVTDSVLKFLNNGQWGDVADLHHYGIVRIHPESDLGVRLRKAGVQYPEFVSQQQLTQLLDKHGRTDLPPYAQHGNPEDFASGGLVRFDPDEIAQMAGQFTDQFTPGYAAGGLVKYDPAEIDTIVSEMKEAFHG